MKFFKLLNYFFVLSIATMLAFPSLAEDAETVATEPEAAVEATVDAAEDVVDISNVAVPDAHTEEVKFLPVPGQMGMMPARSPVQERLYNFHDQLLVLITVISIFVLALMVYVCVKFSEKANPEPSKTTHHNLLEVVWTLVPALVLVVVGYVSWHHLYYIDDGKNDADMTIKVIGYQWYWNYEYPDHEGIAFDSYMIKEEDEPKPANYERLLSVDNAVVVPVNTKVRLQITAGDVIHAFALPSFGVKIDAVPGHLNETWFEATEPGLYYGQCSELCGVGHGFMPINIHVVSEAQFAAWVAHAKTKFAANGFQPLQLAELNN